MQILDPKVPLLIVNGSGSCSAAGGIEGNFLFGNDALDSFETPYDSIFSFPYSFPFLNTDNRLRNDCRKGEVFFSARKGGVNKPTSARFKLVLTSAPCVPCGGQAFGVLSALIDSNRCMSSLVERRRRMSSGPENSFGTGMEKYSS